MGPVASSLGPFDSLGRFDPQAHLRQLAQQQFAAQAAAAQPAPAPAASAPPAAAAAPAAPQLATPTFQDAQYGTDVNQLIHDIATQRAQLNQAGQYDQSDYGLTQQRMNEARGKDLLNANHSFNDQGLFESGQLTQGRNNIEHDYQARQEDARTAFDRRAAARQAQIDQLGQVTADSSNPLGYTATGGAASGLSDIINAAVQRRMTDNASLDAPLPAASVGTSPPGAPSAAPASGFTSAAGGLKSAVKAAARPRRTAFGRPMNFGS